MKICNYADLKIKILKYHSVVKYMIFQEWVETSKFTTCGKGNTFLSSMQQNRETRMIMHYVTQMVYQ